jgi:hypothetical protein
LIAIESSAVFRAQNISIMYGSVVFVSRPMVDRFAAFC